MTTRQRCNYDCYYVHKRNNCYNRRSFRKRLRKIIHLSNYSSKFGICFSFSSDNR